MTHHCNFYCHGTVHGVTVLVPPGVPEGHREDHFRAILAHLGATLLAWRPAPETDVPAVMAHATQGAYITRAGHVTLCRAEGVTGERPKLPYLALIDTARQEKG